MAFFLFYCCKTDGKETDLACSSFVPPRLLTFERGDEIRQQIVLAEPLHRGFLTKHTQRSLVCLNHPRAIYRLSPVGALVGSRALNSLVMFVRPVCTCPRERLPQEGGGRRQDEGGRGEGGAGTDVAIL